MEKGHRLFSSTCLFFPKSHILLRLDQTVDIHECGTVQEAVAVANHISEFDLVLLDMQLPGLQGLEGLLALKGAFPTSPITLISGAPDQRRA